ncbi:WYL domain-containing protein [Acinetobacter ursingii]|uniref:WYL domain-containing protein n=1 Tax=Acinetobacter ursingii TaxID=108980 RepID=UPI0039B754A9
MDGHRWHVRAFCRTRKDFRDFVLARIITAETLDEAVVSSEQDIAWHTYITLVLSLHLTYLKHIVKPLNLTME